jgi:hypothetical protein
MTPAEEFLAHIGVLTICFLTGWWIYIAATWLEAVRRKRWAKRVAAKIAGLHKA